MSLHDGIAVITGAGSGLGRALSLEFTGRGFTVFGIGRRDDALCETESMIVNGSFIPHAADVSDFAAIRVAFDRLDQMQQPVTILINNAAIYERFDFLEREPTAFMRTLEINLGGMINCSHAALQQMTQSGFGRIINVSSFADLAPLPGSGAYSVSKGAARIFTRALVADIRDRFPDIVINDWTPGALATTMGIAEGLQPSVAAVWGVDLTLLHDRSINGIVFDRDREVIPPRSIKQRIKDLLLLRPARSPRVLSS